MATALPTIDASGQLPASNAAWEHWLASASLLPSSPTGSITSARLSVASSMVCAIVVLTSTGWLTAPVRVILALNSGVNG